VASATFCTLQDAAHPENRTIAQAACDLSGWCSTPIDPSKPDSGFFTVDILRNIAFNNQYDAKTTFCNSTIQPRSEQIYNWLAQAATQPAFDDPPPPQIAVSLMHSHSQPNPTRLSSSGCALQSLPTFRRENLLLVSSLVFSLNRTLHLCH